MRPPAPLRPCILCARPLPRRRWWQHPWLLGGPPLCKGDAREECHRLLDTRLRVSAQAAFAASRRGAPAPPVRPEGTVIVRPSGQRIPVEVTYAGLDDQGRHQWDAITPVLPGDRFECSMLPARTSINFPGKAPS